LTGNNGALFGDRYVNSSNAGLIDRLIRVVRQLLDQPAMGEVPFPVEQQLSELGMSSLRMVNLMLSVESEFDIMIPAADITPQNFHSVASIAAMVARLAPKFTAG
jgi:acyl carrier protein